MTGSHSFTAFTAFILSVQLCDYSIFGSSFAFIDPLFLLLRKELSKNNIMAEGYADQASNPMLHIKTPRYKIDLDMLITKGFLSHAKDVDALNPGVLIDGPQHTEFWVLDLHRLFYIKEVVKDSFPTWWSRERKMRYMWEAERQNDARDPETVAGRKLEEYWNGQIFTYDKPDLETRSGDSANLFGQYIVTCGMARDGDASSSLDRYQRLALEMAVDPSRLRHTVANIVRIEEIEAAGNPAIDVATGQICKESFLEYEHGFEDEDEMTEEEREYAKHNAWKKGTDIEEVLRAFQGADDNYDEDWEENQELEDDEFSGGLEHYNGTREEREAAMQADEEEGEARLPVSRAQWFEPNHDHLNSNKACVEKSNGHQQDDREILDGKILLTPDQEKDVEAEMRYMGIDDIWIEPFVMDGMKKDLDEIGRRLKRKENPLKIWKGAEHGSTSGAQSSISGGVKKKKNKTRGGNRAVKRAAARALKLMESQPDAEGQAKEDTGNAMEDIDAMDTDDGDL